MKLLALVLLFGIAAAYPFAALKEADDEAFLGFMLDMEESMAMRYATEFDEDITAKIEDHLREQLDNILERIKEAIDHGRAIKEDWLEQAKELKETLHKLKIDIGNKAKELYEKIKEKSKDWIQKLLERWGLKEFDEPILRAESDDEMVQKLKDQLDDALENVKEAIDNGKVIKDKLIEKVKELRQKLKDLKVDVGNKAKEILEKIKDKARDWLQKILDKWGIKEEPSETILYAELDDDIRTDLVKKMKEQLDNALEKIKEAIDKGRAVKEDLLEQAKVLKNKLQDMKEDIGEKAKELYKKIHEKAKDWLDNLLERWGWKEFDEPIQYAESDDDTAERLKKRLDDALEKIKEAIDKGAVIKDELVEKVKELRQKLKDLKVDVGTKAKELLKKIKDKARDWLQKILDKWGIKEEPSETILYAELDDDKQTELGKKLQEQLDGALEKIKDAIEKGKVVKQELIDQVNKLKEKLKDLKMEIGDKAKELFEKIKEKTKDWLQKLLDKWGMKEFSDSYDDIDLDAVLRGILEKVENDDSDEDIAEYIRTELRDSPLGEALIGTLKQGRKPLRQVVKTLLGLGVRDSRSLKDIYEKLKEYLKDLHLDFKEKYLNFMEWVKEIYSKGKDAAKESSDSAKWPLLQDVLCLEDLHLIYLVGIN